MNRVETRQATVYFAPTAGRRYLTRKAAAQAEAKALIRAKYPTEPAEHDDAGRCTYPGFHWSNDERLQRVLVRLTARLLARPAPIAQKEEAR
ncbi:MAG: hypothetical protein LCH86_09940 [Proteobacteria bacterium]|nr:hypothetical protein [Pseudomonadota bacterium]